MIARHTPAETTCCLLPGFLLCVLAFQPALADADADWAVRSTAPGVYAAVGFDTLDDVALWTFPDGTADHVSWEQTLAASGNGSLRFDILNSDRAGSGSWVHWLSDDQRTFTTGDEFYVQFRQYVPAYYATHRFLDANGWKQIIISRRGNVMGGVNVPPPYGSNQLNEIVLQNTNHRGILQGYNRDSNGAYPPWEVRADTRCSATDFIIQNAIDRGANPLSGLSPDNDPWTACEQDRARFGGLYWFYANRPDGYIAGAPDPIGGAFNYYPDEWLTFYLHVRLGEYGGDSHDTHVTLWAARESDLEYTMVIDRADIDLGSGPNHDAIWLLPFNTDRSADPTRQDTYTLYDELIVSANPIPVPTVGLSFGFFSSDTTVEAGSSITLTWTGDAGNTCTASGDWSGNKAGAGTEQVGPLTQDSQFILQCFGAEGDSTRTAVVDVVPADVEPPMLEQATAVGNPNVVTVTFSEGVGQAGAEALANYTVSPGVTVTSATRQAGSGRVVRLATNALTEDRRYTVAVNNVTDQSNAANEIAADSQASFEYFTSLAGGNTQPAAYQWSVLAEGELVYIDRPYTYAVIPAQYAGFDYLLTANGDKNGTDEQFLSFELDQAATVYVGHDRRIGSKPAWLDDWTDSGDDVLTSDATFDVFAQEFAAGTVNLGGNQGNGNSMYLVLVGPSAPPLNALPRADFDFASTQLNTAVAIGVLANDSGLADAPVTVRLTNMPAKGTAFVRNNRIVYTPTAGFAGLDRLSYRVTDVNGDSDGAAVTIAITLPARASQPRDPAGKANVLGNSAISSMILDGGGGAAHPGVLLMALLAFVWRANRTWLLGSLAVAGAGLMVAPVNASPLGDAAAAMSPGTFVELPTEGLTRDMMTQNGCSSPITSYSDNAVWDEVSRRFLFVGGPHGCPHAFVEYREFSNSWSNLTPLADSATHAYDHTTIDPASRTLYFRKHSGGGFHAYDLVGADWTLDALPKPPSSFTQVSGGLEYFPDIGRLVHINYGGAGEVDIFEGEAWSRLAGADMGERAAFIEYNPVHGLMLFGGGVRGSSPATVQRDLHVLDANRNVVQRADAPIGLAITKSIVTVDPVSGKYLVFGNGGYFYEYDVATDIWRSLDTTVPFLETVYDQGNDVFGTVAAPVSTHGVVMFLQYLGSGSKVWLYKHQDSGPPDITPPGIPANLSGSGSSEASISLAWSEAVDAESGVFSYEVYRDNELIAGVPDTSYTDTGLADATAYSYQVAAINGSGLVGSRSPATLLSTLPDVQPPSIDGAVAFGDAGTVIVTFSEAVSPQSAGEAANYAVSGGVSVLAVQPGADGREVVLSTSPLSRSVIYTLTVNNVTDQATTPNWIMPGSEVAFEFSPSLAGNNTVPEAYAWGRLWAGAPTYIDRAYFYTSVPTAYEGLDYLLTANDDKGSFGNPFIGFDLPEPATVYVAYDARATVLPAWLGEWTATGATLATDDTNFNVFARELPAGPVSLGGNEGSSPSMYTVLVGPGSSSLGNSQPLASNDSASTNEGRAVAVNVLANDSGLEDTALTLSIDAPPAHGTVAVAVNRVTVYTPAPGFSGADQFSYRVTDRDGESDVGTVTIKVIGTGRDATPAAVNDIRVTPFGEAVTIDVMANDAGLVDTPIVLTIITPPAVGTTTVVDGNQVRYSPVPGVTGVQDFTYRITDADGDASQATVSVITFANRGAGN